MIIILSFIDYFRFFRAQAYRTCSVWVSGYGNCLRGCEIIQPLTKYTQTRNDIRKGARAIRKGVKPRNPTYKYYHTHKKSFQF